jgi:FkbM family methyltransferase
MTDVMPNLIFDTGLHKGLDAQFYLQKDFSVVGLEASPELCSLVRASNAGHIASGKLTVIEKALFHADDEIVEFFINPEKDDWGSLYQGSAEKGIGRAVKIAVPTITLDSLFRTYGIPHYLKCDIEGGDALLAEQLLHSSARPTFVSLEATSLDDVAKLLACGYDRFQLVNQYMHPYVQCPSPAREGSYVDARFSHESSGPFGRELPAEKWTDFSGAAGMFLDWYSLRQRDVNLAIGWLDVHVCRAAALA